MKTIFIALVSLLATTLAAGPAGAWSHGGSWGGSTSHSYGSTSHSSRWGGSTSHTAGEGTSHTSTWGTSTSHSYGEGTSHTNAYGGSATHYEGGGWSKTGAYGGTAYGDAHYGGAYYHPPAAYYPPYHPPTTVNYYGSSCNNCGGWSTAGAAAAGAALGVGHRRGHCLSQHQRGHIERLQCRCCRRQCQYLVCLQRRGRCRNRQHHGRLQCRGRDRHSILWRRAYNVCDGCDLRGVACRLHHAECPGQDLLPVREHMVPAVLRRKRRLLPCGAYTMKQLGLESG